MQRKIRVKELWVSISTDLEPFQVQKVAGSKMAQVTHFENALRTRRFIYPNFFFHRCLVEMIIFPRSIVLLVKAMYQSAFLGLEFSQNTVVVITIERCKIRKSVKFSRLHFICI